MRNILKHHSGTYSGTGILGYKKLKIDDFHQIDKKPTVFLQSKKSIKLTSVIVQLFI